MKSVSNFFPYFLVLYHLVFAFIAWQFVLADGGDAIGYWFVGEDLTNSYWWFHLKPGTDSIKLITFPLVKYFHLPFWSGFFIFSAIGAVAYYILSKMLFQNSNINNWPQLLIVIILLFPNGHFWTSLIGKESLMFLFIVIFFKQINFSKYYGGLIFISLFMIAWIRPHVAFVIFLSYILSLFITQKLLFKTKVLLSTGSIGIIGIFLLLLINIQDFSGGFMRVVVKYQTHIKHFQSTDAYVPLEEYFLPYKLFTFYFRPLPFEKNIFFYQILGIENLLLFLIFLLIIFFSLRKIKMLKKEILFIFPLIFLLLYGIMYVYAYANFGIIMRTKAIVISVAFAILVKTCTVINQSMN